MTTCGGGYPPVAFFYLLAWFACVGCTTRYVGARPLHRREVVHAPQAARVFGALWMRQFHRCFLLCRVQEENEGNRRLVTAAREEAEEWKTRFEAERALRRALNAKLLDMQVRTPKEQVYRVVSCCILPGIRLDLYCFRFRFLTCCSRRRCS